MKTEDLKRLVEAIDGARRSEEPTAHVVVSFSQELSDDPLPYVFDYVESLEMKVVHVTTLILPGAQLHRELVIRRQGVVWDGSI